MVIKSGKGLAAALKSWRQRSKRREERREGNRQKIGARHKEIERGRVRERAPGAARSGGVQAVASMANKKAGGQSDTSPAQLDHSS